MIFELILNEIAPTDNHIYLTQGRRRIKSPEATAWKEMIGWKCKGHTPTDKPVRVEITITFDNKRKNDIGNRDKITLDAMQGYIYEDDSQIHELRLIKKYGPEKKMKIKVDLAP